MELHLPAEQQARLADLASRTGRNPDELVQEAVARLLDYETWFAEKVQEGLDQIERGQVLTHDEVLARAENRLRGF